MIIDHLRSPQGANYECWLLINHFTMRIRYNPARCLGSGPDEK